MASTLNNSLGPSDQGYQVSGFELWQWRCQACQQAIEAKVPIAEVDWLLQTLAGLDKLVIRLASFEDHPKIELHLPLSSLTQLWQQRIKARVPVQYLAGSTSWRNFVLAVSPAVLIPRPETESLVDLAIAAAPQNDNPHISLSHGHWAELGTGSGAIALGLASAFPKALIHAVDCSADALKIAYHNAQHYNLEHQIQFYQGSWFRPLNQLKGQISGMVANPPYIPSQLLSELQPEVSQHEPHIALDGGVDGLGCIRHLVTTAPDYLCAGGLWLIELMAGQAAAVVDLLQNQGSYRNIQIHADLAGIDRFVMAYRC
ncbi:MAG: peptide chain release factor N(5)-glutamine methyltransferase [Cyanothece sp. SIO1E1]|nr:peptide chain release factor N(5)-glutamine methyltransferase [Cyanothece sp. SIO1E1]